MRLTLAQLEAFYWVSTLGSVSLAAQQLNLAQPTISLRVKELENSLQRALFERDGRGLRVNDDGLRLLERASAVLGEIARIRDDSSSEVAGTIRIGFAEGFAMACLAPFLERLSADYPSVRAELFIATSSTLERDMSAHRLDLAFLVNPIGHSDLRMIPLGAQPNVWAASPRWRLDGRIRPQELRGLPIITNPAPAAMYRQIVDWFATAGLEPARLDICTSVSVVAHVVASGVAIGLLPLKMIEPQVAEGRLQVLQASPPVQAGRLYAAFRTGAQSSAVDAVLRTIRTVLSTIDYLAED